MRWYARTIPGLGGRFLGEEACGDSPQEIAQCCADGIYKPDHPFCTQTTVVETYKLVPITRKMFGVGPKSQRVEYTIPGDPAPFASLEAARAAITLGAILKEKEGQQLSPPAQNGNAPSNGPSEGQPSSNQPREQAPAPTGNGQPAGDGQMPDPTNTDYTPGAGLKPDSPMAPTPSTGIPGWAIAAGIGAAALLMIVMIRK